MEVPDYPLPEEAIAQVPLAERDAAKLLVAIGGAGRPAAGIEHRRVRDLPDLLGPGDLVVVNTTRVLPARLKLHKETGGQAEVFLLERLGNGQWEALVRPGRRLPEGTVLLSEGRPAVEVGERIDEEGTRLVKLMREDGWISAVGEVPLPPYIHTPLGDPERYQTVYSEQPDSVAAPTAGLHLTEGVLAGIESAGARLAEVELAVGLGTFRPVTAEAAEDHVMHSERYRVPPETMAACKKADRVIAVGTTTLRALEAAAASGKMEGRTDLYIHGDFPFQIVDVLMTNFHQPRSTLLLLLESFAGPGWREAYAEALATGYRFLSFGDAMIVSRAALAAGRQG